MVRGRRRLAIALDNLFGEAADAGEPLFAGWPTGCMLVVVLSLSRSAMKHGIHAYCNI